MTSKTLFSIIIPARNEEVLLPGCLDSIRKAKQVLLNEGEIAEFEDGYRLEVIVVSNRCTDRTEEIAERYGCLVIRFDAKNLAAIRNAGVRASSGEIVLTIDADSRMSERMLIDVWKQLQNRDVIGGGTLIVPERISLGILVTGIMLLPIAAWYRISAGLFFFRRTDFDAIGGFDEKMSSVEDIAFAKALGKYGRSTGRRFITLFRSYIKTSCRKFDRFGDWYFVRNFRQTLRLLKGRDQELADKVWYDFPR